MRRWISVTSQFSETGDVWIIARYLAAPAFIASSPGRILIHLPATGCADELASFYRLSLNCSQELLSQHKEYGAFNQHLSVLPVHHSGRMSLNSDTLIKLVCLFETETKQLRPSQWHEKGLIKQINKRKNLNLSSWLYIFLSFLNIHCSGPSPVHVVDGKYGAKRPILSHNVVKAKLQWHLYAGWPHSKKALGSIFG